MAHAQKPDFSFDETEKSMWPGGGCSSVDHWQPRCAGQLVAIVPCWRGYAPRSCEACWIPTRFSCYPFTSPPTHRRVPCHVNRALLKLTSMTWYFWFSQHYFWRFTSSDALSLGERSPTFRRNVLSSFIHWTLKIRSLRSIEPSGSVYPTQSITSLNSYV
jgi:hypothetical protein